jgi:hypothetical protein
VRIGRTTSGGAHQALDSVQTAATMIIESAWDCFACEVGGMDVSQEPTCWSCGGPVAVHSIRRDRTPDANPTVTQPPQPGWKRLNVPFGSQRVTAASCQSKDDHNAEFDHQH